MIDAYYYTMQLLEAALGTEDPLKGYSVSPGPVDLGEGSALILTAELDKAVRSIAIGVVDADPDMAQTYGVNPVQVTVTLALGYRDAGTWFQGKAISARIGRIVEVEPANSLKWEEDYGQPPPDAEIRTPVLVHPLRGESFMAEAAEDDLYLWWRSFLMHFRGADC